MPMPMVRGSRWVPPMSGTIPSWTSGMEKIVPSAASRMSQQSASSMPAPMQTRWMAAITGTRTRSSRVKHSWRCVRCSRILSIAVAGEPSSRRPSVEPALTSRPAQKAPPAPSRTTARTPGAASTATAASRMPSHTSTSTALSRSGLLSVMVATGALISTSTLLVMSLLLYAPPSFHSALASPLDASASARTATLSPSGGEGSRYPSPLRGRGVPPSLFPSRGEGSRNPSPLRGEGRVRCEARTLPVEGLHQRRQARVAHVGLIGLIERDAVEQARVALHHLVVELVVGRGDRVGVEHLVGDEIGHALPVALHALPVELSGEAAPAVHVEHGLIRAGGGVEGDLLLHHLRLRAPLLLRVAHDDEAGGGVGEVLAGPAGLLEPCLHRGMDDLAEILGAIERMHVHAVAELARDAAHVGIDRGDHDGDLRMLDGSRVEERRHDVEGVELPLEVQFGAVLPAVPDGPDGPHRLRHLGPRRLELYGEATLVVRLDLAAEPQDEAAPRGLLEIPRDHGRDHGAPREDGGDVGAELDARGHRGSHGQGEEGIVLRLRRPEGVVAHGLDLARVVRERLEVMGEHADVELHDEPPGRGVG